MNGHSDRHRNEKRYEYRESPSPSKGTEPSKGLAPWLTRIRVRGRIVTFLAWAFALVMIGACGRDAAAGPTLAHAHDSPEAVAEAVLAAIAREDAEALGNAMVSRDEYRALFWPELPESDDMPFEAAWQMNEANSRNSRNSVLAQFGGSRFELVSIEFPGGVERYPNVSVHFDAKLVVRRPSDGRVGTLELLAVVGERDGRWKALNYHDD